MTTRLTPLSDQTYSRLRHDTTKRIERQVQNHLKAHADKGETEPVTYRKLNPSHTKLPYLYGLPKIKKTSLSAEAHCVYSRFSHLHTC